MRNRGFTIIAMRLANKVAIVTGGGSGIGRAIAVAFAHEGAKVVISGRDQKKLDDAAKEIGGNGLTVSADLSNSAGITKLGGATIRRFKQIGGRGSNAAARLPGIAARFTHPR